MKIRYRLLLIALTFVLSVSASANYTLTKEEQNLINKEAEDWIDGMPDGLQDKLSDAVNHALRGFNSEVNFFRNIADTAGLSTYKVSVKNVNVGKTGNVMVRLYKGVGVKTKVPLLIYFHGGGWSLGSVNVTEKFCRALAASGKVIVASVEYPLSPEYPYPAAIDFCSAAIESIAERAKEWGSEPGLISLGGDGAGGNIALSAFEKIPSSLKIKSIVLYYPLLKSKGALNPDNKRKYGRGYGFDSRLWEAFSNAYNGQNLLLEKKLPAVLLISAGRDIIIDQEKEFSKRGITYVEFSGALHGFITDGHQKTAFKKAVELTVQFLGGN